MSTVILFIFPLFAVVTILVIILLVKALSGNGSNDSYQRPSRTGRLCKSENNRIIAGVCGGIAEYFGWNAGLVRVLFILLGVSILAYIVLAIFMPEPYSTI